MSLVIHGLRNIIQTPYAEGTVPRDYGRVLNDPIYKEGNRPEDITTIVCLRKCLLIHSAQDMDSSGLSGGEHPGQNLCTQAFLEHGKAYDMIHWQN